ncbi:MAG: hypothetical protein LBD06_12560 [Candidatus Accumulibacter sp.]|nr:hypothetical protein [Accumulibacter sp.]
MRGQKTDRLAAPRAEIEKETRALDLSVFSNIHPLNPSARFFLPFPARSAAN